MKSFPTTLNITHSGCNLSILMSKHFQFSPNILVPTYISHPRRRHIFTGRHPIIHTFRLWNSECPIHPIIHTFTLRMSNPPQSATSATLWTPGRLYKSTLRYMSFSDTPHPDFSHQTAHHLCLTSIHSRTVHLYALFHLHHFYSSDFFVSANNKIIRIKQFRVYASPLWTLDKAFSTMTNCSGLKTEPPMHFHSKTWKPYSLPLTLTFVMHPHTLLFSLILSIHPHPDTSVPTKPPPEAPYQTFSPNQ